MVTDGVGSSMHDRMLGLEYTLMKPRESDLLELTTDS